MSPDLIIRAGAIVDGSGRRRRTGDVAVDGGRIVEVGTVGGTARRVIDADGAIVAPGFIDLHTHCDFTIHERPDAPSMVRQGVTTIVTGNCGFSGFPAPSARRRDVARWARFLSAREELLFEDAAGSLEALETLPLAPNVAQLVGHGTLRMAAGVNGDAHPTAGELHRMEGLLEASLAGGAAGLSSGLIYPPGRAARASELHLMAAAAARHATFYATHVRDEGEGLVTAVNEAIEVSARTGVAVHVSHLKGVGQGGRGLVAEVLDAIDEAVARGLDVTADQYPYTASSTKLGALFGEGGLIDATGVHDGEHVLVIDDRDGRGSLRTLAEIAAGLGATPVAAAAQLAEERGDAIQVILQDRVTEADVRRVLRHPDVAVASDGWSLSDATGGNPHPRSFGTFARVLGLYCRELQVLGLEAAIRKMTSVPARRLGMTDRGLLTRGSVADIVIFDPGAVAEAATYSDPYAFARGIEHVIVGGQHVIDAGEPTGARPGRALRHTGSGWSA